MSVIKGSLSAPPKRRVKFALCGNFFIYLVLVLSAVIFTQALRSSVSAVLYVFLLILPLASLCYLPAAGAALKIFIDKSVSQTVKLSPVGFSFYISNESFIPVPFAELDVRLPDESGVRCATRRVRAALSPFGRYDLSERLVFPLRGSYDIGVSDIYVYDLFRMFRLRVSADVFTTIYVLPRRLTLDFDALHAPSDVNTGSPREQNGVDRVELSDIRAYQNGDHMKNIHWNLSSKTQELMVKKYAMNTGNHVYIFVDTARVFDLSSAPDDYADDIDEFAVDGVIELAAAATLRELDGGNDCTLAWFDSRYDAGSAGASQSAMQCAELESARDFDRVFVSFGTAGLCDYDESHDFTRLPALITETQGITVLFITARMNADSVRGMSEAARLFGGLASRGAISCCYFDPSARIISDAALESYRADCEIYRRQLIEAAVAVTEPRL